MAKMLFKTLLVSIAALSLANGACTNESQKPTPDETPAGKSSVTEIIDPDQSQRELLEKQSPYTLDQLKTIIPQELIGAKLSASEAKSNMGAAFASADYKLNDSATIELDIFDCAGTEGAGIYDRQYLELLKSASPDEDTKLTISDFRGSKALMQENKKNAINNFTCLSQKRFLVTLEGKFVSIELLKQAAASINFPK